MLSRAAELQAHANLPKRLADERPGMGQIGQADVFDLLLQVIGMGDHAQHGQVHPPYDIGGPFDRRIDKFQQERQAEPQR